MNSHQLRVFLAVAQHRSFTRAAEALFLTQSAVSQQIEALEREHEVRLFDRLPRRVALTEAGRVLLPYAERGTQVLDDAVHALDTVRGVARGRLRVGASPTPATYLLPAVLGAFARQHPHLELLLEVDTSTRIAEWVASGGIALGVVEGLADEDRVTATPLLVDELVLITAPDVVAEGARFTLDELVRLRYIAREPTALTRLLVDAGLHARGVEWRPVMELGHIEAIKRAVAAGLGVAFLSHVAVADEITSGRLRAWLVEGLDLRRPWYLLQHRRIQPGPAAAAFAQFLREHVIHEELQTAAAGDHPGTARDSSATERRLGNVAPAANERPTGCETARFR
jgi:DNA-binding transcriptional LysR family regulator